MINEPSVNGPAKPLLDTVRVSRKLLNLLGSKRQREILCAHLGLYGPKLAFKSIAKRYGTSYQSIVGLEDRARKNLRRHAIGGKLGFVESARTVVTAAVEAAGATASVNELCTLLHLSTSDEEASRLLFIISCCPGLSVIPDGREYRASITTHPPPFLAAQRARLIDVLAMEQEPRTMLLIAAELGESGVEDLAAIADICKDLAQCDGLWALRSS